MDINQIETLLRNKFAEYDESFFGFGIRESYFSDENIRYFNFLTGLKRKDINLFLWNEMMNFRIDEEFYNNFDKTIFTQESLLFLTKYINTINHLNNSNLANIGNSFETERLLILPGNESDANLLFSEIKKNSKEDVDFLLNRITPNSKNALLKSMYNHGSGYSYASIGNDINIGFAIKLKETNTLIGFIQFFKSDKYKTPEIGYYMFKNHRHNGYANEALSCLITNISKKGLKYPTSTKFNYELKVKIIKPSIIRATPNSRNNVSISLLKKLGFTYSGTSYKERIDPYTKEELNVDYYYLELNNK